MFGHTPSTTPASESELELAQDLKSLKKLLTEKYLDVNVADVLLISNEEIKVRLVNGRHGIDGGIDGENERPIEYLKSFDGVVTKEAGRFSYCSYSSITFPQTKIKDVIEGLKAMETPKPPQGHMGKITLRC